MSVGFNTADINAILLDDGMPSGEGAVGWGENMQIVGPGGNPEAVYLFYAKMMDMSGTVETPFFWGDDNCMPVDVSFDMGDGVGIDNANGASFVLNNSGEVPTKEVKFAARSGLNWSGNPFPAKIDINAVLLDDGMPSGEGAVGWGENMQIVGPGGNPEAVYLFYAKMMDMSGTVETPFFWGDDNCMPVDVQIDPGAGFAIDNANGATFDIKIACPYTLQ